MKSIDSLNYRKISTRLHSPVPCMFQLHHHPIINKYNIYEFAYT